MRGMKHIDDIDRAILAEMIDDSEICAKTLAQKIGIHPNTLFQRLKRLRQRGALVKCTSVLDYELLGYPTEVVVFIKVNMEPGWEDRLKPVSRHPNIVSFMYLTGEYDAMAVIRIKSEKELPAILKGIQANEVVVRTLTNVVLDRWKRSYEFNPFRESRPCLPSAGKA